MIYKLHCYNTVNRPTLPLKRRNVKQVNFEKQRLYWLNYGKGFFWENKFSFLLKDSRFMTNFRFEDGAVIPRVS